MKWSADHCGQEWMGQVTRESPHHRSLESPWLIARLEVEGENSWNRDIREDAGVRGKQLGMA